MNIYNNKRGKNISLTNSIEDDPKIAQAKAYAERALKDFEKGRLAKLEEERKFENDRKYAENKLKEIKQNLQKKGADINFRFEVTTSATSQSAASDLSSSSNGSSKKETNPSTSTSTSGNSLDSSVPKLSYAKNKVKIPPLSSDSKRSISTSNPISTTQAKPEPKEVISPPVSASTVTTANNTVKAAAVTQAISGPSIGSKTKFAPFSNAFKKATVESKPTTTPVKTTTVDQSVTTSSTSTTAPSSSQESQAPPAVSPIEKVAEMAPPKATMADVVEVSEAVESTVHVAVPVSTAPVQEETPVDSAAHITNDTSGHNQEVVPPAKAVTWSPFLVRIPQDIIPATNK